MKARKRSSIELPENPPEGFGRLILTVNNRTIIKIGETSVILNAINRTGTDGGDMEVRLLIEAHKNIRIERIKA